MTLASKRTIIICKNILNDFYKGGSVKCKGYIPKLLLLILVWVLTDRGWPWTVSQMIISSGDKLRCTKVWLMAYNYKPY